jgi:hypothetical protein
VTEEQIRIPKREPFPKREPWLNVIVSASGDLDPRAPFREAARIFAGEVPVLVVSTEEGARRLRTFGLPGWVKVRVPFREVEAHNGESAGSGAISSGQGSL